MYPYLFKINHGFEKYNGEIIPERILNSFIWHTNLNRGLETFLKYFHLILKEFPDSKIYICGDHLAYNNNMVNELLHKYEKYIIYTSKLTHKNVLELLRKCDFFCYTGNIIESFSLSLWEAAINGCIPIVYSIGALSEIKNVGGIVIENNNINNLIENVLNLLRNRGEKIFIREKIVKNIEENIVYKWSEIKEIWYETIIKL